MSGRVQSLSIIPTNTPSRVWSLRWSPLSPSITLSSSSGCQPTDLLNTEWSCQHPCAFCHHPFVLAINRINMVHVHVTSASQNYQIDFKKLIRLLVCSKHNTTCLFPSPSPLFPPVDRAWDGCRPLNVVAKET